MQGAGMFSALKGYLKGANVGQAAKNMGQLASYAHKGLGTVGRGTLYGAGAGAAWGAASDDTSVLGGALMGAGLGRYGTAAIRQGSRYYKAGGTSSSMLGYNMWRGVRGQGMRDAVSMRRGYRSGMASNTATAARSAVNRGFESAKNFGAGLRGNKAINPGRASTRNFGGGARSDGRGVAMGADDMRGKSSAEIRAALDAGDTGAVTRVTPMGVSSARQSSARRVSKNWPQGREDDQQIAFSVFG